MIIIKNISSLRGFVLKNAESKISSTITHHQSHNPVPIITRTFKSITTKTSSMSPSRKTKSFSPIIRAFRSSSGSIKKVWVSPREVDGGVRGVSSLIRPAIFTVVVSGASYTLASIWQYENLFKSNPKQSQNNLRRGGWMGGEVKTGDLRQQINYRWNSLSQGEKSVAFIIALNGGVFMLWRVPSLQPIMAKLFTATPMTSKNCLPMLLSTFSHHSLLHLMANMYVLWSFTPSITRILGNEQFVATYLTAGVVSSLGSYALKVFSKSMIPSLGASGAIMAVLGMVCVKNPDAQLSVAFVSSIYPHSFSADTALKSLILLDSVGILLRWRLFDHAAHLAGVLFGIWYVSYGSKIFWQKREPLVRKWHQWRSGKE